MIEFMGLHVMVLKMLRFSKFSKLIVVAVFIGFFSILADAHADEYPSKQTGQQNETCCVTCCPAHHLAPPSITRISLNAPSVIASFIDFTNSSQPDPIFSSIYRPPIA